MPVVTQVTQSGPVADQGSEPEDRLRFFWASDVKPVLNGRYAVKGVIQHGTLAVVYGESNSGKTFFVLDMVMAIAGGQPWRNRPVSRGLVVYIAGEGTDGIRNRIAAYQDRGLADLGMPLAVINRAADLLHVGGDMDGLIELIQQAESEAGEKCTLIVVDTLARAMAGGDENSGEDMTALIGNADRLRKQTMATVMFIHHSGKDATKGARGHSSLRGAVDTEILIAGQEGKRTATVTKQRDLPGGQVFEFELEQKVLGHDDDGEPVTSCIVKHLGDGQAAKRRPKAEKQLLLLAALESRERIAGKSMLWSAGDLRPLMEDLGITHRNTRRSVLIRLVDAGFLKSLGGCYSLAQGCT